MAYSASIALTNRAETELTVFIEPGTQIVRLPAGRRVQIIADAERPGDFEIDYSGDYLTVSAWPTAVVRFEVEGVQSGGPEELPGHVVARGAPGVRPPTFVSVILVGDNQVTVEAAADVDTDALRALGGRRGVLKRATWTFPARDERSLASLVHELRDLGVAFAWEPGGWPPAAVFAHLRERGLVQGSVRAITWRPPGNFQIFEF